MLDLPNKLRAENFEELFKLEESAVCRNLQMRAIACNDCPLSDCCRSHTDSFL